MSRWRDDLERELRESPIPPHRPDHFERVRERIREAAGHGGGGGPARPSPAARRRRRPAPPGRIVRFAATAAAAAAIVAAVAFSWTGLPGLESSAPAPATAGTVLADVRQALAHLSSIHGDVVEYGEARGRPFARHVGSFTFTSRGDYRVEQVGQGVISTYDAQSRVAQRSTLRDDGSTLCSEVARDLPDPGPFFSPWMGVPRVLDRSVAAYARAVIAELDPDVPVRPVAYEGRTAWSITVPEPLRSGGAAAGSAHIVVDAESGYPLVVEHWTADGDVSGTRIENVRVGGDVPRGLFAPRADAGHDLLPMSERFRRMSLRQAARLGRRLRADSRSAISPHTQRSKPTGFTPYMSSWVPKGYRLSGVTGAVNGGYMAACRPAEGGAPDSLTVVLTYRRGFDRFCIVSRWRHENPPGSDDPFDENSVALSEATQVPVTYGSLRGEMASVVLGLPDWPHLYVSTGRDDRVSVSVAGDLTRDELLRIADSLEPIAE